MVFRRLSPCKRAEVKQQEAMTEVSGLAEVREAISDVETDPLRLELHALQLRPLPGLLSAH
jgi:hypothetical protein